MTVYQVIVPIQWCTRLPDSPRPQQLRVGSVFASQTAKIKR